MKIIDKITNFVYCITHTSDLLAEIDALKAENVRLNMDRAATQRCYQQLCATVNILRKELTSANDQVEYAEKRAAEAEKNYERMCNEASQLSDENCQLRSNALMYHGAFKALCEQRLNAVQAKSVYESVAHYVDKDGFELFGAAQQILGSFDFACFAYEDNLGYFEEADGNKLLRYLLVQYDHKLGAANDKLDRWQIACSCYEKCVDLSIDETTPEYQEFEKQLYIKVLENLNLLTPAKTQAEEVSA